jgi:Tol biopolymer transport system component
MSSDGSGQENLTETPGAIESFSAWSPDGGQVAFDSDREAPFSGDEDVFSMEPDGSDQAKLSGTLAADDYAPSWQPDGDDRRKDD